jgi:hypothetical protein
VSRVWDEAGVTTEAGDWACWLALVIVVACVAAGVVVAGCSADFAVAPFFATAGGVTTFLAGGGVVCAAAEKHAIRVSAANMRAKEDTGRVRFKRFIFRSLT